MSSPGRSFFWEFSLHYLLRVEKNFSRSSSENFSTYFLKGERKISFSSNFDHRRIQKHIIHVQRISLRRNNLFENNFVLLTNFGKRAIFFRPFLEVLSAELSNLLFMYLSDHFEEKCFVRKTLIFHHLRTLIGNISAFR